MGRWDPEERQILTPEAIYNYCFLQLILYEHTPLLASFGFVKHQKWLVSININLRKRLNSIDSGVKIGRPPKINRALTKVPPIFFLKQQESLEPSDLVDHPRCIPPHALSGGIPFDQQA